MLQEKPFRLNRLRADSKRGSPSCSPVFSSGRVGGGRFGGSQTLRKTPLCTSWPRWRAASRAAARYFIFSSFIVALTERNNERGKEKEYCSAEGNGRVGGGRF